MGKFQEKTETHEAIKLAGLEIKKHNFASLTQELSCQIDSGKPHAVLFANANMIVSCQGDINRMRDPRITVVNDGVAVDLAARWFSRGSFPANLNGTDYTPYFLKNVGKPLRLFLYGANATSNAGASRAISSIGHTVSGTMDGYKDISQEELLFRIRESRPDVVLVALGNPRQERWILDNLEQLPPALYFAIGALFDFLAGSVPRAPTWVRKLRLEWAFRLVNEPRRLLYRYTIGGLIFIRICSAARR